MKGAGARYWAPRGFSVVTRLRARHCRQVHRANRNPENRAKKRLAADVELDAQPHVDAALLEEPPPSELPVILASVNS